MENVHTDVQHQYAHSPYCSPKFGCKGLRSMNTRNTFFTWVTFVYSSPSASFDVSSSVDQPLVIVTI